MATAAQRYQGVVESPELQAEGKAIAELWKQGNDGHWQLGFHYNNIIDNKLAENSGYHHVRDYFARWFGDVPQSTLNRCGSVARAFSEDVAKKYGVSKLARFLAYEKLAHLEPSEGDPGAVLVQVPSDGAAVPRPFEDCHEQDLALAIRHLRDASKEPLPPEDAAVLEAFHMAFGDASPVSIGSRRGSEGNVVVLMLPIQHAVSLLEDAVEQLRHPSTSQPADPKIAEQFAEEFKKGMETWIKEFGAPGSEKTE